MKVTHFVVAMALATAVPATAADRMSDREVKDLIERLDQGRDKFESALDGSLKDGIVRGASGEVKVENFLNDFQENVGRLKDRLKPEYAASTEADTVLRQATAINRFVRSQPAGFKGESEWNTLAADLTKLSAAYGTEFPLAENAKIRRMGDRELATSLDQLSKSADALKKSLDADLKADTTLPSTERSAVVSQADQLSKSAKTLRDRVKDGKPSSAEADQLFTAANTMRASIGTRQLPKSTSTWGDIGGRLTTVAGAYGKVW